MIYHTLVENVPRKSILRMEWEGRQRPHWLCRVLKSIVHSFGNCRCRKVERGGTLEADSIWILFLRYLELSLSVPPLKGQGPSLYGL